MCKLLDPPNHLVYMIILRHSFLASDRRIQPIRKQNIFKFECLFSFMISIQTCLLFAISTFFFLSPPSIPNWQSFPTKRMAWDIELKHNPNKISFWVSSRGLAVPHDFQRKLKKLRKLAISLKQTYIKVTFCYFTSNYTRCEFLPKEPKKPYFTKFWNIYGC